MQKIVFSYFVQIEVELLDCSVLHTMSFLSTLVSQYSESRCLILSHTSNELNLAITTQSRPEALQTEYAISKLSEQLDNINAAVEINIECFASSSMIY